MTGERSVQSDDASDFRQILERISPDSIAFRSELISEVDSHKARKLKTPRSSFHRRHRSHRERPTDDSILDAQQVSRLLAHDALESAEMRRVLIKTSERLEQETRRANDAENRARDAEARALALQISKRNAQTEVLRDQETLRVYRTQLDTARAEILRAQQELNSMASERDQAEDRAARDRSTARAMAKEIEIRQALEQGRHEGKLQGFVDGRKEGWYIGIRDGRKDTLRDLTVQDEAESVSSGSSTTSPGNNPRQTTVNTDAPTPARSAPRPPDSADPSTSAQVVQRLTRVSSSSTVTRNVDHKRSGSFAQSIKSHLRRASDPKLPPTSKKTSVVATSSIRTLPSSERLERSRSPQAVPSTSRDPGRISPIPYNPPPSPRPRSTSPLPEGYIPLQENGRVSLPPPHDIEPPPSPHSPSVPLPQLSSNAMLSPSQQPPIITGSMTPTITVQQPTPPEPALSMPEPHPAPAPPQGPAEINVKPSRVVARDLALDGSVESPPLPPLPTERSFRGKQRQRQVRPRGNGGLHAPGKSSPSDTSTEFSQFDIVTPTADAFPMGRGNGSKLSIILEGGSNSAESPGASPEQMMTPRAGRRMPLDQNIVRDAPRSPSGQGLNLDFRGESPRHPSRLGLDLNLTGDIDIVPRPPSGQALNLGGGATRPLTPTLNPEIIAPTSPSGHGRNPNITGATPRSFSRQGFSPNMTGSMPFSSSGQGILNDPREYEDLPEARLSSSQLAQRQIIADQLRRTPSPRRSARDDVSIRSSNTPRRRPDVRLPERLGPSRDVQVLEKQAEIYDAFGTGRYPIIDSQSSPEDAVATRTPPPVKPTHRRAASSATSIVPDITIQPPSRSSSSRASKTSIATVNLSPHHAPIPIPTPGTPSRRHSVQGPPASPSRVPLPQGLSTPYHGEFALPAGFVPAATAPAMATKLTSGFSGPTPARIPLPLSVGTIAHRLPEESVTVPRGTGRSKHSDLPSYEAAPVPPGFKYPPSFGPARVPLPESVAGNSPRGSIGGLTSYSGRGGAGPGGPPMPPVLSADRPMAMYAGDGGATKKVSSSSLASDYKKFDQSTYLDPAFLASADSASRPNVNGEDNRETRAPSRAGSVRSARSAAKEL